MQIGTLVSVTSITLAGTCLPTWVGRVDQISGDLVVVKNDRQRGFASLSLGEVKEIAELLPVR